MDPLDALRNEAAAVDSEAADLNTPPAAEVAGAAVAGGPGPVETPAPVDPVVEVRGWIDMALAAAVPMYPDLDRIYTPDAKDRLAKATAALLAKYNMTTGDLMGKYKEEIEFGLIAIPLGFVTFQVVKASNAKRAAEAKAKTANASPPVHMEMSPVELAPPLPEAA